MLPFIEQGGPFAYALSLFFIIGLFFILERIFFFQKIRFRENDLLLGLQGHIARSEFAEALHELARIPSPTARMSHIILSQRHLCRSDLNEVASQAAQLEIPRLEKNLRILYAIALIAPLLGMLGTISGIMQTFENIHQNSGADTLSKMSSGLYESLLSSGLGLAIAIFIYLFYLFFYGRVQRSIFRMRRFSIELINLLKPASQDT